MQFGVLFLCHWPNGPTHTTLYQEMIEQIDFVESAAFDAIWLSERHFIPHGGVISTAGWLHYLAARTKRVRIGTACIILPFHNPLQVAEDVATADILGGGRISLFFFCL